MTDSTAQPLGLSTAWNGAQGAPATTILAGHRSLGFTRLEAYAHFTPAELTELGRVARDANVEIGSLHGPCPIAVDERGQRTRWWDPLASTDPRERTNAVDVMKRTIDAAAEHGARAVVVHLGNTGVYSRQTSVLNVLTTYGRNSEQHRRAVDDAQKEREARKGAHLDAALTTIRELGEYANGTGVALGVEARDNYHEIPSLDEVEQVLAACEGLPVYYWHDAGHGAKLDYLGFAEHEEYLRRHADRMLGMHVHDTRGTRDHQAPGQGDTDFEMLARYLKPETIKTLELHPSATVEQINQALDLLRPLGAFGVAEGIVYQC